mmetsp:Transcript_33945/g.101243  ORF Transcript_33945/g.101243 Transcript_33945/m.101243 type:complete len:209 (-) Transcript_33945:140-766(-)
MSGQDELHQAGGVPDHAGGVRPTGPLGDGGVHGLHQGSVALLFPDEPQDRMVDGAVAHLKLPADLRQHQLLQLLAGVHSSQEGQEVGANDRHQLADGQHGLCTAPHAEAIGAMAVARLTPWMQRLAGNHHSDNRLLGEDGVSHASPHPAVSTGRLIRDLVIHDGILQRLATELPLPGGRELLVHVASGPGGRRHPILGRSGQVIRILP